MSRITYTFDEYINNPSGKGSAVNTTARSSSDSIYQAKLSQLTEKSGPVKYKCVRSNDGKIFYILFFIPSESVQGFTYETVVEFTAPTSEGVSSGDLRNYTVRFFSNDPSFVYTYAYAYKTHGLLITQFEKKINLRALITKAKTRNPDNSVGYVKNIYFAYLVMKRDNLFDKAVLSRKIQSSGLSAIMRDVMSFDNKEASRDKRVRELKGEKETERKEANKVLKSFNFTGGISNPPSIAKLTKRIMPKTSSIKKSSTVKRTKKI